MPSLQQSLLMLDDQLLNAAQFMPREALIIGQLDLRVEPELCGTTVAIYVYVRCLALFPRVEGKPVRGLSVIP
jgi:hypothetical protein